MTAEEEQVLADLAHGKIGAQTAIARLVSGGKSQLRAEHRIFIALGGSDLVDRDAQGRACYRHSGKLVAEVDQLMRK